MFFPEKLKDGATIGLVQPASSILPAKLELALRNITGLGFQVYQQPSFPRSLKYLGGTDAQRAEELHHMFASPEVDAIWCVRGGYGTQRMLPLLDFDLIARHPKPFIGFSDITALANSITQHTGLISYHGIMGVSAFSDFDIDMFRRVVQQHDFPLALRPLPVHAASPDSNYHPYVITPGRALGQLMGGNLALLAAAVGTDFDLDYTDKILLLEDINEPPYRVDRMLTQLLRAGKLDRVAGIALGIFETCHPEDHKWTQDNSFTLREVLFDRLAPLGIPTVYGLPFGHIDHNATLPIGAKAMLHAEAMELTIIGQ